MKAFKKLLASDKCKHFGACMAVAAAASAAESAAGANPFHAASTGLMAGMAIGVGKEYGDHCSPGNRWDWADIAADAAGSLCGSLLGSLPAMFNR